jgi:transposase
MIIELRWPGDLDVLEKLERQERNARQRDRYRAVLLALNGKTAPEIAAKLDRSRRFVQQWTYRYRDGGPANLIEQARPGAPTKLRRDDEAAFQVRIEGGPNNGDGVCTLRGKDLQRILKEEFSAQYTLDGVYDLLHRLGYSCLKPRPRHRKNDTDRMHEWRRSAPFLSSESKRSTRTSASKFGSRMKPGSANRER